MRITKHRKSILKVLEETKKPISADDILLMLPKNSIDLSTIYRSLDIMHSNGLISKSVINNTSHYFLNDHEHHHFMVCLSCKNVFELDCHIEQIINTIELEKNFKITQHDLTFYGHCNNCK